MILALIALLFVLLPLLIDAFSIVFMIVLPFCGTHADKCHENATCTDTGRGEYICACKQGYTGDGKQCVGKLYAVILY